MAETLAINGGPRALSQVTLNTLPPWPTVDPETADLLRQVYLSRAWSFNGAYEQKFARAFAAHHSAAHGLFMVNGTVTMECALKALGVGEGDEVIVPALTWMATAMAAVYVGATPVFVDIEPDTMCLDPARLEAAITPKTRAVIPVHLYGSMADMEAIMDIADKHGIAVVEDCAHAHGGVWQGRGVGSIGNVGSFSLQQSKTLTSGEGGMCITNDADLYSTMFRLKHIGYDLGSSQGQAGSGPPEGLVCHNYRGTEFQAVVLLGGLAHLQKQTQTRDANAAYIRQQIADLDGIDVQARGRLADLQGYYAFMFLFDLNKFNNVSLARLRDVFAAEGLGLSATYGPVYSHKLWSIPPSNYRKADDCTACEDLCANRAMGLAHHWLLADRESMNTIVAVLRKVSENRASITG